jgi:hypothetical protein
MNLMQQRTFRFAGGFEFQEDLRLLLQCCCECSVGVGCDAVSSDEWLLMFYRVMGMLVCERTAVLWNVRNHSFTS